MISISASDRPQHQLHNAEYEDFYRYTSGRWLWAEDAQLRERYKRFNVPGLKRLAADATGAHSCVSITKLAEGGFNKVFRLLMDNDAVVIARIPNPNVGPASKVIASEVATMDFVRNVIGIPVPRVLAWNGHDSNSAESEYILMEEAKGTLLEDMWPGMELNDKLRVVDDLVDIQKKLQSVTFSRYGNIYFKSNSSEGCSKVEVSGELPKSARMYAEERFVLGPVAERSFWDTGRASLFADRGPWSDAQGYLRAISQRERSKMSSGEILAASHVSEDDPDVLTSPQARISLLDKFDDVSPYLAPRNPTLNKATLSHWDLRAPNLFIEDGRITSLIDWQDAWVGPLFMQERRPQLIQYHGEMMLQLPDYYETMEDKEEKAKLTKKVEASILYWYYGRETKGKNPTLQNLFDLPLARTRLKTVLYASEVWVGGTTPLRECLYRLQRQWDQLHTGFSCPIRFTDKEIEAHDRASADWNETAEFWSSLEGFVSRDGYTSIEDYQAARTMFEELREEGLAQLSGIELAKFAEQTLWAKRSI